MELIGTCVFVAFVTWLIVGAHIFNCTLDNLPSVSTEWQGSRASYIKWLLLHGPILWVVVLISLFKGE